MKIKLTLKKNLFTPDLKRRLFSAQDPRKAMEAMALVIVSMAQRAFTQPGMRPEPWPALHPKTVEMKRKKGYGSKPLIATGTLARSPRIVSVGKATAVVGSDRKAGSHSLAAIHQLGTKDGHITPRPFFPFDSKKRPTERARKMCLTAAQRALDAQLKR